MVYSPLYLIPPSTRNPLFSFLVLIVVCPPPLKVSCMVLVTYSTIGITL